MNLELRSQPFPFPALIYNALNSSIDAYRGKHDTAGSMTAGAITGALFKSTGKAFPFEVLISPLTRLVLPAGVKPALISATIVSGAAGLWSFVKKSV